MEFADSISSSHFKSAAGTSQTLESHAAASSTNVSPNGGSRVANVGDYSADKVVSVTCVSRVANGWRETRDNFFLELATA